VSGKKALAYAIWPRGAAAVSAIRARRRSHRLLKEWGLFDLNRRVTAEFGMTVTAGPFRGLKLSDAARQEHVGPYVLGTYELELHDVWKDILDGEFDQILDVGANFGYYAAGLARRWPWTPTFAFDTDWWARKAVRDLARLNGLTNISVLDACTPAWLAANMRSRALVVSDCEGYEGELFARADVPAFNTSTFVIELHEQFEPGVTENIRARFSDTHRVRLIDTRTLAPVPPPAASLTTDEMARAVQEPRGPQQWLVACTW